MVITGLQVLPVDKSKCEILYDVTLFSYPADIVNESCVKCRHTSKQSLSVHQNLIIVLFTSASNFVMILSNPCVMWSYSGTLLIFETFGTD